MPTAAAHLLSVKQRPYAAAPEESSGIKATEPNIMPQQP